MLYWLLSHEALQVRVMRAIREARTPLTAERPKLAPRAALSVPAPLQLSADGATAVIRVEGVLTPTPDMMAAYHGEPNTTYGDLRESLRLAMAEPNVRQIEWSIDSPGGAVDGLFALLDDIEDARAAGNKPMRAIADNAHSAAYGIAAAVGNIQATGRTASFGSVGVATSGFISGGICGTVVDMTNSDAPEKRPNLATDEGKAVVVKYLDQLAGEFMGSIARGRGVDPAAVAEGFGRGSSMLAGPALAAGLIDSVASRVTNARTLTNARTCATLRSSMAVAEETPAPDPAADPAPAEAEPESAPAPAPSAVPAEGAPETEPAEAEPEPAPAPAPAPSASVVAASNSPRLITALEYAEFIRLRADRDKRETAERRALITDLVALEAETPETAWERGAPAARLASEDLGSLRKRVAALRAARPAASALLKPPASGAGTGIEALEDFERAAADKITDPAARERFIAKRVAKKQKAQNQHG